MRSLPRTVVILGLVSLLNDAASEMITPLLPIFLTTVLGSGPAIVGLIEGVAESTASILKLVSGRLADRGVDGKALVMSGYGASNVARPLIGLALGWTWVLALRFVDRVGKGLRTAPRDALIAASTQPANRGVAFGFHRSMDHSGAVVGPLLAYALLTHEVPLAVVFYWSIVPGALVMLLLWFGVPRTARSRTISSTQSPLVWKQLDARLRALIIVTGVLALAAVPETFVVLWAKDAGLAIAWVPLLWAAASLLKMLIAFPAGALSDRFGRLPMLVIGLGGRVIALLALAMLQARGLWVWLLFLAYSASLAMTEPAERSLVGDRASSELRGTAYGWYHLASGLLALPGAILFGLIWEWRSAAWAFTAAALLTLSAALALLTLARRPITA